MLKIKEHHKMLQKTYNVIFVIRVVSYLKRSTAALSVVGLVFRASVYY